MSCEQMSGDTEQCYFYHIAFPPYLSIIFLINVSR